MSDDGDMILKGRPNVEVPLVVWEYALALEGALRKADGWLKLIPEWDTDCTDLALVQLAELRREIAGVLPPTGETWGLSDQAARRV